MNFRSHSGRSARVTFESLLSRKEEAHKHKQFYPAIAWVKGAVSRPGGQGSNVYVLCADPKEHKHFCPGTRPGGSVTGVTETFQGRKNSININFLARISRGHS